MGPLSCVDLDADSCSCYVLHLGPCCVVIQQCRHFRWISDACKIQCLHRCWRFRCSGHPSTKEPPELLVAALLSYLLLVLSDVEPVAQSWLFSCPPAGQARWIMPLTVLLLGATSTVLTMRYGRRDAIGHSAADFAVAVLHCLLIFFEDGRFHLSVFVMETAMSELGSQRVLDGCFEVRLGVQRGKKVLRTYYF